LSGRRDDVGRGREGEEVTVELEVGELEEDLMASEQEVKKGKLGWEKEVDQVMEGLEGSDEAEEVKGEERC